MSRGSGLFTIGIFIIFLAILFHYFCRSRKKPEIIMQQQVMPPPEGYVYPITPNSMPYPTLQQMGHGGSNNAQFLYPSVQAPYPVSTDGQQAQYVYPGFNVGPNLYPQTNQTQTGNAQANPQQNYPQVPEDLPPPYHVAVGTTGAANINSHPH